MSRRPYADPGDDSPDGEDALTPREEPTLRAVAVTALLAADFTVLRNWPLDRGAFPNEVILGRTRVEDGADVAVLRWHGVSQGSAVARHQGAFAAARAALARVGLYAHHEGGLRLEVGWLGTAEGEDGRWAVRRLGRETERTAA